MQERKAIIHQNVKMLLYITAALVVIGTLFIYSASSVYALEKFGSSHYFVRKQLLGLIVALMGFIICRITPCTLIERCTPALFLSSLILTACTLIPRLAFTIHGSRRWLNLAGFSLQPSEILKVTFVMYIAYFLARSEQRHISIWRVYIGFFCALGITAAILLKQPDFGLTVTLCTTACIMLFIRYFNFKHILICIGSVIPLLGSLIYLQPYRLKRLMTFLNPWNDPKGAGFQIIQSLIAIGSGGFWGIGVSQSKQKFFYLPMQHTDFIFSIIAEETGFLGSCFLVLLYALFLYVGFKLAWQIKGTFPFFTVLGLVTLLTLQTIINLCVTTGLLPTKGIGLPFVSYGNSGLLSCLCMVGLIITMSYEKTNR